MIHSETHKDDHQDEYSGVNTLMHYPTPSIDHPGWSTQIDQSKRTASGTTATTTLHTMGCSSRRTGVRTKHLCIVPTMIIHSHDTSRSDGVASSID